MTRAHRIDVAGAYYHVWNRAIARRSYMEQRADFRYFKSRLAYAARRGEILVIAFALMTTHFHLLLRSLGGLSKALHRIQNEYGRRFNRIRKRDGGLVRARFGSKRITTLSYRRNALFYIDENPVQARLAETPEQYKWGSAHLYAQEHRPLWLDTRWVDSLDLDYGQRTEELWTPEQRVWRASLMEARMAHCDEGQDPLDDLISGLPDRVLRWMIRKAELADGTRPGLPVVGPLLVGAVVEEFRIRGGGIGLKLPGARKRSAADLLLVGLLRDLAGQRYAEIAKQVGRHPTTVRETHRQHARLVLEVRDYASLAHDLVRRCLAAMPR